MSQKRYQSISERFRDVLEGPIDDFMVKFQWDSGFLPILTKYFFREWIFQYIGPQMWSDDGKNPGNERPPSIAISRCQNFYQTPSELGDRSISKSG